MLSIKKKERFKKKRKHAFDQEKSKIQEKKIQDLTFFLL